VSILCYHTVEPNWRSPLAIEPAAFEAHGRWLARRAVVPLAAAVGHFDRSGRPPHDAVAITFDDGLSGVYEHAFPVLRRHALPATVFVVAETLTPAGRAVDWVDTPPPFPMRTVTLDQLLEMQADGVTVGSHSYAHHDLTALSEREAEADLRQSRELLEDLLHRPVPYVAYPRGQHDAGVRRAAEKAGFTHAFTLPEGPETVEPHAIPRVGVYPGNGPAALLLKTRPWYLGVRTSKSYPWLRRLARRGRAPARRAG